MIQILLVIGGRGITHLFCSNTAIVSAHDFGYAAQYVYQYYYTWYGMVFVYTIWLIDQYRIEFTIALLAAVFSINCQNK